MNKEQQTSRNTVFISLLVGGAVVLTLLLLQASNTGINSVMLPSELAALSGESKQRIRLAGRVADDSISYEVEPEFLLAFSIHDPGKDTSGPTVPVSYSGIKPDMFAVGRDVILEGRWEADTFVATKLMTQCPSKYEAPLPPGAKPADKAAASKY